MRFCGDRTKTEVPSKPTKAGGVSSASYAKRHARWLYNSCRRNVERLSRLAFTAPAIVEAIRQGRQPAELSAETLLNRIDLPLEWPAQLKAIRIE